MSELEVPLPGQSSGRRARTVRSTKEYETNIWPTRASQPRLKLGRVRGPVQAVQAALWGSGRGEGATVASRAARPFAGGVGSARERSCKRRQEKDGRRQSSVVEVTRPSRTRLVGRKKVQSSSSSRHCSNIAVDSGPLIGSRCQMAKKKIYRAWILFGCGAIQARPWTFPQQSPGRRNRGERSPPADDSRREQTTDAGENRTPMRQLRVMSPLSLPAQAVGSDSEIKKELSLSRRSWG